MITFVKEKFTKSAFMHVLSLAVCISLFFFMFSFISFPVSAVHSGSSNNSTINGYTIISDSCFTPDIISSFWLENSSSYNDLIPIIPLCLYNGTPYIPYQRDKNTVLTIILNSVTCNSNGIVSFSGQWSIGGSLSVFSLNSLYNPNGFVIDYFDSYSSFGVYGNGPYYLFDTFYDFSGNDCTSLVDPSEASFFWCFYPFYGDAIVGSINIPSVCSNSDGSGYVPPLVLSRARFNCFGDYSEVTYSDIESKYTIGHFKKKTVTDEKWGKPATKYYFSNNPSLSTDFPDYASRYISFSYYNDSSFSDGITIRVDAIYQFTSKDIDDILDINTYICVTHTYIPCVALYSSSSMSAVPPNTTVYYKMDLANALNGLSRVYTYVLSIYQNSDNKLLTSTCINWRGETDEIFGCSSIGIDGNGIIESSIESSSTGDIIDDITLVPDDTGNMQDDLLIADDIQPENKIFGVDLNNFSVTDISGELVQASSNASQFLQACYSLYPPAIWTIVIAGISLIVLLRILGR